MENYGASFCHTYLCNDMLKIYRFNPLPKINVFGHFGKRVEPRFFQHPLCTRTYADTITYIRVCANSCWTSAQGLYIVFVCMCVFTCWGFVFIIFCV